MTSCNITEFQLEARYISHRDAETLTVKCGALSFRPAEYGPDNVAADGAIMRSLTARPSLLAKGVDRNKLGTVAWTNLRFKDAATGAHKEFDIEVMDTVEPETVRFGILREV